MSFLSFWTQKGKENTLHLDACMYHLPPFLFLRALFVSFGGKIEASMLSIHTEETFCGRMKSKEIVFGVKGSGP